MVQFVYEIVVRIDFTPPRAFAIRLRPGKAAAVDYWTSRRAVGFADPPTLGPAVD